MIMSLGGVLIILIIGAISVGNCNWIPENMPVEKKKDLFVSRGWGAGGMPNGIPYIDSPYSSILRSSELKPLTLSSMLQERTRKLMQIRTMNLRHRQSNNGVIPQLFVSTGWGPNGRR